MAERIAKQIVTALIPGASERVAEHHQRALNAIEGLSSSRKESAETNLRVWRRRIKEIDPTRDNGWAFSGSSVGLKPGATALLSVGTLVVTCDVSWAKAQWPSGQQLKPIEVEASLYEVTSDGLKQVIASTRPKWACELLEWITENRPDIPIKKTPEAVRQVTS
jgi:hypothetical protein